ncbi:ATP-dependent DNA helicase [Escherichia coli]|nr:ATP-dependent DNA helicase [Escherichia coli]
MISTFHTLGLDIIKREYAALGMKANFSLFDDTDQLALLKELTEGLIEDDKVLLQQLISTISNWKERSQNTVPGGSQCDWRAGPYFCPLLWAV